MEVWQLDSRVCAITHILLAALPDPCLPGSLNHISKEAVVREVGKMRREKRTGISCWRGKAITEEAARKQKQDLPTQCSDFILV